MLEACTAFNRKRAGRLLSRISVIIQRLASRAACHQFNTVLLRDMKQAKLHCFSFTLGAMAVIFGVNLETYGLSCVRGVDLAGQREGGGECHV